MAAPIIPWVSSLSVITASEFNTEGTETRRPQRGLARREKAAFTFPSRKRWRVVYLSAPHVRQVLTGRQTWRFSPDNSESLRNPAGSNRNTHGNASQLRRGQCGSAGD